MATLFTNSGSSSWDVTITDGSFISDNVSWVEMNESVYEMGKNASVTFHLDIPETTLTRAKDRFEFLWDEDKWLKVVNIEAWWQSSPVYSDVYEYALGKNWMVIPV